MRPIDKLIIGPLANMVRQPLVALRSLGNTWLNDKHVLAWSN